MDQDPRDAMRRHLDERLAGLAHVEIMALVDGVVAPVLIPLYHWPDPTGEQIIDFDRQVIARTGLRKFIRPITPLENRMMQTPADDNIVVVVTEWAPGVRNRQARYFHILMSPRDRADRRRKERRQERRRRTG